MKLPKKVTYWNNKPKPEWIDWQQKHIDEKTILYGKMSAEERELFYAWLNEDSERKLELHAIKNHKQPCYCLECSVYRNKIRRYFCRPVNRYPR